MTLSRRARLLVVAALLACVAVVAVAPTHAVTPTAPSSHQARSTAAVTSFRDPAGDAKGPLDVVLVDIVIQAGGLMRMSVTIPNSPKIADQQVLGAVFDTDRNKATGAAGGGEFYWSVQGKADGSASFTAYKWNGKWERRVLKTYAGTPWNNGETISFSLAELGSTSFTFAIYTKQWDTDVAWDWAPDSGSWSFTASKPAPARHLRFGAAATNPKAPTAGLPFYVAPAVKVVTGSRSTGLRQGKVRCKGTVGGAALPAILQKVSAGKGVVCGWRIPGGSSGSTLAASVVVSSQGITARKAYRWQVR